MDEQIYKTEYPNERINISPTLNIKNPNVLISFSKPNSKYMTAFTRHIYWNENNYVIEESTHGNLLFILNDKKVIKYYETSWIYN